MRPQPARRIARIARGRGLGVEPLEDRCLLSIGPFPTPLESLDPAGSLIYAESVTGSIAPAGETDSYTINLDEGQTITVVVDPEGTLAATVELFDSRMVSVGSASAAVGEDVLLQTVPMLDAGVYRITIGGGGGPGPGGNTGDYTTRLILGAAVESEEYGGAANDGPTPE